MKKIYLISAIVLLFTMIGCVNKNNQSLYDLITIDINKKYHKKELILQDVMDVEYIALETSDEFITQGIIKSIGKNVIIITNRILDGDIFIFDRKTGKGIRKINRLGQGPEEYSQFTEIILDEDKNEIFVIAYSSRKILVYDLNGNFKRKFIFDGEVGYYNNIFNYDKEHLICHKGYSPGIETEHSSHILISKQDGLVKREIELPYSGIIKTPVIIEKEGSITPGFYLTVPNQKDWVIMRTSSDTIYNYSTDDNTLTPIITRIPSIQSMNPEIFLFPIVITDRYYFMRTMKKEIDFTTFKGFPETNLMYDKQEKSIFEYAVLNNDFSIKREVSLGQKPSSTVNQEIATCLSLNAFELVEALDKNELKGELKNIAQELDEESNPVIMLVKHRNK
jgi:hypothetical protein